MVKYSYADIQEHIAEGARIIMIVLFISTTTGIDPRQKIRNYMSRSMVTSDHTVSQTHTVRELNHNG
jgi:hypothetical protein